MSGPGDQPGGNERRKAAEDRDGEIVGDRDAMDRTSGGQISAIAAGAAPVKAAIRTANAIWKSVSESGLGAALSSASNG